MSGWLTTEYHAWIEINDFLVAFRILFLFIRITDIGLEGIDRIARKGSICSFGLFEVAQIILKDIVGCRICIAILRIIFIWVLTIV